MSAVSNENRKTAYTNDDSPPKFDLIPADDSIITRIMPSLAQEIGLNECIVLLQICFWIQITNHYRDGQYWTYQSVRDMQEKAFPYWSLSVTRHNKNMPMPPL